MKTITKKYKVYTFKELPEDIQEKVIENNYNINVDCDWWDSVEDDAKNIGLDIREFDTYQKSIGGELTQDIQSCINDIVKNHGESTDTYKLATRYQKQIKELGKKYQQRGVSDSQLEDYEDEIEELTGDFKHDLLEEYLSMLDKEYDYLTGREAIEETIEANEFTFLDTGKMFNE